MSPFPPPSISNSTCRTESRQTGRDTPASTKESLVVIPEDARPANPELDRSVDLFIVSNLSIDHQDVFESLLPNHIAVHEDHPMFALPASVRRRIYSQCFPHESRKIRLSPRFAIKAVFPDDYFASPWDVLEPVFGGLHSFRELRRELMIYFWTTYHFHVTLSPFTGPKFSPLSHIWLPRYLEIIQYLTIEADLTRFGFSALRVAPQFGFDVHKTEQLIVGIVNGLLKRHGKTTMVEFNIMCRRYAGFRPYSGSDQATFEFEAVQYCPDEAQFLCDTLCSLRGILQKCRISGFTFEYTEMLLRSLFADGDDTPSYSAAGECAWPPVPVQTPFENFHPSFSNSPRLPFSPSQFELSYTPTSSFAKDVEDEMLKYESSVYSEKTHVAEEDVLTTEEDQTSSNLAHHVQKYQECVGLVCGSDRSNLSSPQIQFSDDDSLKNVLAAAPPIDSRSPTRRFRVSTDSGACPLSETLTNGPRCETPRTPSEMNRMNQMNEQDPAFVRTVEALHSLEDEQVPAGPCPKSIIPSQMRKEDTANTDRCKTSMNGNTRTKGTVRRYLSFVKKLRGRGDRD